MRAEVVGSHTFGDVNVSSLVRELVVNLQLPDEEVDVDGIEKRRGRGCTSRGENQLGPLCQVTLSHTIAGII